MTSKTTTTNATRLGARLAMALLAGAAFAPFAAQAQDVAAADSIEDDTIIVTAQKTNRTEVSRGGSLGALGNKDAADVPFSVKSYNAALILNQQPQTLGQLLENDPTIRTTYGFGNAAEQFVVRGFVLAGDDVALDSLYGITPRQLIAPELYESVQVLNGASAFLNGAAPSGTGIGGSVNLIPKRATGKDLQRITLNYTGDEHIGGSFDFARRPGDGSFGIRINGAARRGDVSIDDEFRSTYVIGAALDYNSGPLRVSLDLGYQRVKIKGLRHKVVITGLTSVPKVPKADHNYSQPWTYSTLRDVFGMAKIEYDLSDDAMLYASFGARDGSEDGIYGGLTVTNALTGDGSGNALFVPRTDNNEAGQAGIRVKLAAGGVTQEFNLGGSAIWQVNRNAYDFLYGPGFAGYATNLYDTVDVPLPSSSLVGGDLDNPFPVGKSRLTSLFASDTIGLWEDRVLFTAGLRLQTINVKAFSYFGGALTTEYDESAVTPVFGLVVKPVEGVSLFANRIQGLAQGPSAPIDVTVINAGEVFGPAKSTQYEIGGKVQLGRFNASVALFRTDQPSAFSIPDPQFPGFVRFGVYGKQRNRGIELSVDGEVTEGLRLIAGGSIIDAKFRDTQGGVNEGNRAPGVPKHLANANVEWDLPFLPALTLTGRVVYTGEQKIDSANTLELPDWTRFDVGMRYVALVSERPLTLRFNVDNVANKRFWASSFDIFSPQLLQGAPRTFKLSASIDL